LTSQAALQVHPSPLPRLQCCDPAALQSQYVVEGDAELHCHWDPVIPFAGARVEQRFELRVDETSRLYWSDALMAGRVCRGEAWRFDSLAHELALRASESLVYLERYRLEPRERSIDRAWIARSTQYLGTTLIHHSGASRDRAECLHRALAASQSGARMAVDFVSPRLLVCRVTSPVGPAFARMRAAYRTAALDGIFQAPELACRK
jgi:urease accessory protein UreH